MTSGFNIQSFSKMRYFWEVMFTKRVSILFYFVIQWLCKSKKRSMNRIPLFFKYFFLSFLSKAGILTELLSHQEGPLAKRDARVSVTRK